jgi:hypothetical protein
MHQSSRHLFGPSEPNASFLLSALSAEAARLIGPIRQDEFRQGAVLWDPAATARQIFFPISGVISIRMPSRDGSGIGIAMIGSEAAAVFHDRWGMVPVLTQGIVQAAGRFASMDAEAFERAADQCEELRQIAAACQGWLVLQSQQGALCNAIHIADARFCRWVLRMSDALGVDLLRVTQGDIAQLLGIRRTTANLIAQRLQQKEIISWGRGKIAIRDRAGLQSAACDCYAVLGRRHWPCELLRGSRPSHRVDGAVSLSRCEWQQL